MSAAPSIDIVALGVYADGLLERIVQAVVEDDDTAV
jgi:hypothetical protein